jgi:hypothetical protein
MNVEPGKPIPPEVMREQRMRACMKGSRLTGEQVMEKMFRNGVQIVSNPFRDGRWKTEGLSGLKHCPPSFADTAPE